MQKVVPKQIPLIDIKIYKEQKRKFLKKTSKVKKSFLKLNKRCWRSISKSYQRNKETTQQISVELTNECVAVVCLSVDIFFIRLHAKIDHWKSQNIS